jgi:hypothetical protein
MNIFILYYIIRKKIYNKVFLDATILKVIREEVLTIIGDIRDKRNDRIRD